MTQDTVIKKIKHAAIAATISGSLNLVVTSLAVFGVLNIGIGAESYIDVALTFGLAFGIFKKSRTCALLMLGYFVFSKIAIFIEFKSVGNIGISGLFIYFFIQGVIGTFKYHNPNTIYHEPSTTESTMAEVVKWQCTECGEHNNEETTRCVCGNMDENYV